MSEGASWTEEDIFPGHYRLSISGLPLRSSAWTLLGNPLRFKSRYLTWMVG